MTNPPDESVHRKRTLCRACGGTQLRRFLSLGETPLANSFLRSSKEFAAERFFPLEVYLCQTCSLAQLLDVIAPEILFREYIYVTGTSDTIAAHNVQYARTVAERLQLKSDDLVVEIASNDGSLLKCFQNHGVRTLGIEPATNLADAASAAGVETLNQFFNSATAEKVLESRGPARAVIANNVLAHVDETQDFLRGCRRLLDGSGQIVFEVPYLRALLNRVEYDTIYHEHLCYFSVHSLKRLCEAAGLCILRVEEVTVHGGSLRVYAGDRTQYGDHGGDILAMLQEERRAGLTEISRYQRFAADVEENRRKIRQLLETLRAEGRTLAGYGAPAKGNTLLNYCKVDRHLLPYTVDKNPMKVNLYTPGTHIPVLPVSALLERQPDYVMILAWNFADEIMRQQQTFRNRGSRFIIPIPEPRVV